jgi:hypothetical protein
MPIPEYKKNGLKMFAGSWKDDPGLLFPAKAAHQIVMRRHKAICKGLGVDSDSTISATPTGVGWPWQEWIS